MPPGIDPHEISDIRQDGRGYLWFATGSGLMRFDGYSWKVYQHEPKNPNSLKADEIRTLCPTRDGLIWAGGWSSGLDCLDPLTGKITHHQVVRQKEYKYENNAITALLEDHLGNLWVGTAGGLYRYEKAADRFVTYPSVAENVRTLSHRHVSSIYEDRQGTLWVGTGDQGSNKILEGGLNKLDRKSNTFTRYMHDPADTNSLVENRVVAIFEDSRGIFWVGTGGDGLHTMDRKSGKVTRYPFWESHPERLSKPFPKEKNLRKFPTNGIRFILEDLAGAVWIGTSDAGASRYDPQTGRVSRFETPLDGLPDFNLFSACRTRDGTIWMGTVPGHLVKVMTMESPIRKVKMGSGVHYFEEDATGTFWIGTIAGLKTTGKVSNQAAKWLRAAAKQTRLLSDHITRLNQDKNGNRWISTWTDGLFRYQPSGEQFTHYLHDSSNIFSISPGEAAGYYQDQKGINWVLTAGGLDRLDTETGKFSHFRHKDRDSTSLSNDYVLAAIEDQHGQFWIGTNGGGLNLMNRSAGKFQHFLPWSIVTQLMEDASGTLWVASSLGLHYYDPKRGKFSPFIDPATNKPLPFVKAIVEDNNGNLWLAMSNGIVAINSNRKWLRWFGVNYGISPGEDFFFGGSFKRLDGGIYFGSMEKYFHFQPDDLLKDQPVAPLLNFSDFRIHNQSITTNSKSIELSYDQNVFSIDFTAIDFRHPEQHLYTYMLESYDREWHPVSAERTANYTNVPPGEFNFRVRAANSDGTWIEKSVTILISPPWWRTGWAYSLYALVLVGLFVGGWQILLFREREKSTLKIREIKAQQLLEIDRIKSDFFTNITHEFRTPLTLILSPLEKWLSDMPESDPYTDPFRRMQRNARRLLHLVNQLLDISKLEAGKMELNMRPGDLIHFIHRIADSFISLAESRGIRFHLSLPEGNLWLSFDAETLEKVLTNLLSNAFKFTPENGDISVSLQLFPTSQLPKKITIKPHVLVEIAVINSGTGIAEDQLEKIFDRFHQVDNSLAPEYEGSGIGLALTRELVELHQGKILVSSSIEQGTRFTVSLTLEMLHAAQIESQYATQNRQMREVSVASEDKIKEFKLTDAQFTGWEIHADAPLVLIIEDNADLRNFISQSLVEYPYRVLMAPNGKIGYQLALEYIPDLIISDIMMPGMDGIELCRELKTEEKTSHIPVILLTAKTLQESKINGLKTGADDYLTKPFEVRELLARIDNLIEMRRELKERYSRQVILQPNNIAISSLDEQFLNRAMAVVEQFMSEESFSVDTFGKEIGMSRMQLYRKLHALTGLSPSDFIRTTRLQRAAQLLSANGGAVSQIADQVGFSSHSYFSKCFLEQFGISPSAYLAELKRVQ